MLADRFGIESQPDLNQALRLPGMMESRPEHSATRIAGRSKPWKMTRSPLRRKRSKSSTRSACAKAQPSKTEIRMRCSVHSRNLCSAWRRSAAAPCRSSSSGCATVSASCSDGAQIDPARIAQEAAILAERSDISEELVRLKTHADQADALLSAEGETGKKLDFLLQEMNRETNTILSKTGGLGETGLTLTDLGLAAKAEIDRIREQSLNIE